MIINRISQFMYLIGRQYDYIKIVYVYKNYIIWISIFYESIIKVF